MNLWRVGIDEASGQALGEPQAITAPGPFVAHASISADGTRIAYSSVLQTRNIQRLTLNPSTGDPMGEPTWLTTGSRSWANPDPSPDGQWVVFYSSLQPEGDIYIVRTDGTGLRQVTSEPGVLDRVPRWSPDSQWIAHFSNRSGSLQLWKIRPDGSDLQQLTEVPDATYPVWSPDGSRIAVYMLATKDHPENVYVFDPNRPWKDQTPEILPKIENPAASFVVNSWSPDGERLAGTAGLATQGLMVYSLRSKTFERLTDFGEWPAWLPDSRQLLFVSGGKDFHVLDTKSKNVRKVFSVTRDVIGPPQLSKNGRQAYFSRRVTEADIWLVTIDKQ
jgi:Tol biopolymer transport system component